MIYSISYDLNKPNQEYSELIKKIKSFGSWAKPCESFWLVSTSQNAKGVFSVLQPYIDHGDKLLVVRFDQSDYQGWLSKELWEWIDREKSRTLMSFY